MMIGNRLLYLGGLAAALVFHIFYFGWYSWYLLVLVLCLPWFVLLVSLPAMRKVRLRLALPQTCAMGDGVEAGIILTGGKSLLPPCRVRFRVKGSEGNFRTQKTSPGGNVLLDTSHCGILTCSCKGSRVCDYLGLFGLPIRGVGQREVLVLPRPVPPEALPDLTAFAAQQKRPKPGGGFSEEHELREYRPGDNLRDIHWKLSAKTDRMILREAQEPVRQRVLLTFDMQPTGEKLDDVLSRLLWLSRWLAAHDTEHEICWLEPTSGKLQTVLIHTEQDLLPMLHQVLSCVGAPVGTLADRQWSGVSWHYHVPGKQEVQS